MPASWFPTVNPETITRHTESFQAVDLAPARLPPQTESFSNEVGIDSSR